MKKIVSLLSAVLLLAFALTACGGTPVSSEPESSAPESTPTSDPGSDPDFHPLSDEEARDALKSLLKDSMSIWFAMTCGGVPMDYEQPAPFNPNFFLCTSEDYHNIAELKAYIEKYYTVECAEETYYKPCLEAENEDGNRFIEKDGVLYVNGGGKGFPYDFNADTATIAEQTPDTLVLSVEITEFETVAGNTELTLKLTDGGWRLDTSPGVAVSNHLL